MGTFHRRAAACGRAFLVLGLLANGVAVAQVGPPVDSLRLELIKNDLAQAEAECSATDFWHRLIPQISLSASFSGRNIVFVDPVTLAPALYPRDSYRLSLSISLTDLLVDSRHEAARRRREKLMLEYAISEQETTRRNSAAALETARTMEWLREELELREELARFDSLRFAQGKIGFDLLVQSKLSLLAIRKAIMELGERSGADR